MRLVKMPAVPTLSLDLVVHRPVEAPEVSVLGRRRLLAGAGCGAAVSVRGKLVQAGEPVVPEAPRPISITDAARAEGPILRSGDFGVVGVFDVDWLLEPRFSRLLDHFAASAGAFTAVRFFGALNSGERENTLPQGSGGVWHRRQEMPDFSTTLLALDALVSRGMAPFVTLSFFPSAVSGSPVKPPQDFSAWAELVQSFLHIVVDRFGRDEVGRWYLEVWNEPNFQPFWDGDFDQYLNLYRATSEAVSSTGYAVRLGGPALVYTPDSNGVELMEQFLRFLAQEPAMLCHFISYHRKGAWFLDQDAPWLGGLRDAAEQIAQAVLRVAPGRAAGLVLINNEADMKVGFDKPFGPRLNERFPAWLSASMIVHQVLNAKYAEQGIRFVAASDDANQHLIRTPFDGRRSVMTRVSEQADDLVKLPVYGFYELLPLLADRRAAAIAPAVESFFPSTDLFHLATVDEIRAAVLLTSYPDRSAPNDVGGRGWRVDYTLTDLPWPRVNAVWFCVDATHTNPLAAAGGAVAAESLDSDTVRRVRAAQELGVLGKFRTGLTLPIGNVYRDTIHVMPFATVLLWITPFTRDAPAAPTWIVAQAHQGNAVLRWTPARDPAFYSYEVFRMGADGQAGTRVSPLPLRSALWVDTKPPPGRHVYGVRTLSASGIASDSVPCPAIEF